MRSADVDIELTLCHLFQTKSILGAFGIEVFVDDESSLDMATALSGTGPGALRTSLLCSATSS